MLDYILELIYPTTCGFCDKICKTGLCKRCELKLKKYQIDLIKKHKKMSFNESMHIFIYEDLIREKIISYKFNNKAYLHKTFSKIILKNEKVCGFLKKYDIIIPVPIHKKRKLERGYNQTELIAKEIANQTHLKLEKNILIKQKNIIPQSSLNKSEREQNIKNAFIAKNIEKIINKKILLFDDIYTTGSTANECAKVLKKQGAKQVGVLTIAKD
ncbi:MAG: ComF family protein [Clostridia bacterium]|nr:ComF family protein [Clostridia bacterium]